MREFLLATIKTYLINKLSMEFFRRHYFLFILTLAEFGRKMQNFVANYTNRKNETAINLTR